jgi:putative flippase GtrA
MRCGDRCTAVRAWRVKLFARICSSFWCREKWLFALIGGSVALVGHGLLKLLIALGCAAGIANALQAVTTLQLNFVANSRLTWRRRIA